jgi:hypothetical protein
MTLGWPGQASTIDGFDVVGTIFLSSVRSGGSAVGRSADTR